MNIRKWLSSVVLVLALPCSAQTRPVFTEVQLDNYARAVLTIEQKREEVLRRAKQLPVWESAVQQAEKQGVGICDLKPPEPQLQALCQEMFRHAKETIERYGFDNQEFNQITRSQQMDKELQKRLQQKVAELRAVQSRR